jgi:hypothetical protein
VSTVAISNINDSADLALRLRRVRWAIRAVLTLGVTASGAANILHADPHLVSKAIAAWPPLALLLAVELITRVPVHRRAFAIARVVATGAIATIAAWISYWHMTGVASRYGESGAAAYLLPLSVDGLVVVASISLVELAGRIREVDLAAATRGLPTEAEDTTERSVGQPKDSTAAETAPETIAAEGSGTARPAQDPGAPSAVRPPEVPEPVVGPPPDASNPGQHAGPIKPTPEAVAYWLKREPGLGAAGIAARIGRSPRTVRRVLAEVAARADDEVCVDVLAGGHGE